MGKNDLGDIWCTHLCHACWREIKVKNWFSPASFICDDCVSGKTKMPTKESIRHWNKAKKIAKELDDKNKRKSDIMAKISGTREWAVANANCVKGCGHGCIYCYAKYNAVNRFHTVQPGEWENEVIEWNKVNKIYPKKNGAIMFPTQHDITPNTLEACIKCIKNILEPGNKVLIVSKPHLECVKAMCKALRGYKNNILFRFTIGSMENKTLKFWEPNAPSFGERFDSLQYAFDAGFETSVSCEPMLDAFVVQLFDMLSPYVKDGIWIGKMNNIRQRVKSENSEAEKAIALIEAGQTKAKIFNIYETLKDDPKVRWKESFKEVLGLELANEAGTDL